MVKVNSFNNGISGFMFLNIYVLGVGNYIYFWNKMCYIVGSVIV